MNAPHLDSDELFERILAEPLEALRSRWERLTEELNDISQQEVDLAERRRRAEARRQVLNGIATLRRVELPDMSSDQAEPAAPAAGDRGAAASADGRPSPREAASEIVEHDPTAVWDARALHDALRARQIETSRANVRMILQRLVRDGTARRVDHGRYQSARGSSGTGMNGGDST